MYLQDFYSTDIHSIQMASDPAVTAIVTIYSHSEILIIGAGFKQSGWPSGFLETRHPLSQRDAFGVRPFGVHIIASLTCFPDSYFAVK